MVKKGSARNLISTDKPMLGGLISVNLAREATHEHFGLL